MELWPAIDIRQGRCVRLYQGNFEEETVYGEPLEVARQYLAAGARRLHVVDLDAARTGRPVNREQVLAIAGLPGLVVQAGGGVRSAEAAGALLGGGVGRIVLGTAALLEPTLARRLAEDWPGRVLAGLDYDAESGELAVRGWSEGSGIDVAEALTFLTELGLAGLVVTDISRDGTAVGPAFEAYRWLLGETSLPLVASGGIGRLDDLSRLAALEVGGRRLAGCIVGRALLAGSFGLKEAMEAAGEEAR